MSNVPNPDINTVNRYKDLAIAELRLRKANERGDISEIAKCQDILNKQLSLLNLNHFENNTKTKEDLLLEKKINMIEFEKPAECEDLKKYLDMVGFEKIILTIFVFFKMLSLEQKHIPIFQGLRCKYG